MEKFFLALVLSVLLTSVAYSFAYAGSLEKTFLVYESVVLGEAVVFNGNLFVVTGGVNRGLSAIEIR